jgi:hypothetical protein
MTIAEIPNVDVLRHVISTTVPAAGHEALSAALAARYPALNWRVADYQETWFRPGKQVFDSVGNLIAEDRKAWISGLLNANDGTVDTVWEICRGKGYAIITEEGHTVFAGAAIGPGPEDAIEIKIDWIVDSRTEAVFNSDRPQDANDLLNGSGCWEEAGWQPQFSPRYDLRRMNAIARTLEQAEELELGRRREVARTRKIYVSDICIGGSGGGQQLQKKSVLDIDPDYIRRPMSERRFVKDWAESTAGATAILEHWAFDVCDYEYEGLRRLGFTPRPLTWANELVWQEDRSLYQLMDMLGSFDADIGYPMAWFFHAVYGNRIGPWAIRAVNEGLCSGKVGLPDRDTGVIQRWAASEYGF